MLRTFKYFSVVAGGTPQPVFGTKFNATAAASATPLTITVVDSSPFKQGDPVAICDTNGANEERTSILSVPSSTTIKLNSLAIARAATAYIRLGIAANSVYIQTKDGNTGSIYIGNKATMVTTTGVNVIAQLTKVAAASQPTDYATAIAGPINGTTAAEYWVDGTTNDQYLPSFATL